MGVFAMVGRQLKLLRERAGLSQSEFGALVRYGPDHISAMERGVRTPRPDFLVKADPILNANGLLIAVIPEVEDAMRRARTRHPEWYRDHAETEAQAVELHHYCNKRRARTPPDRGSCAGCVRKAAAVPQRGDH